MSLFSGSLRPLLAIWRHALGNHHRYQPQHLHAETDHRGVSDHVTEESIVQKFDRRTWIV